ASIVRFSKALGYKGFSDLRASLRDGLLVRVGASGMQRSMTDTSDLNGVSAQVFEVEIDAINRTKQLNSSELAIDVVDRMVKASRVWVCGHGTTYPSAAYFAMHFNQVMGKSSVLTVVN